MPSIEPMFGIKVGIAEGRIKLEGCYIDDCRI